MVNVITRGYIAAAVREGREEVKLHAREWIATSVQRLQAVMADLGKAVTAQQVADAVVGHGMAAVGAAGGAMGLLCDGGGAIEVIGARGAGTRALSSRRSCRLETHAPLAVAVRTGEPVWMPSPDAFASHYPRLARGEGLAAVGCVPLRRNGVVWGAIGLVFAEPHPFDAGERAFLTSLARHCMDAMGRAQLHEAERRGRRLAESAAARLKRMQRIAAALSGAPGLVEIAEAVVREGCEGLRATACFVAVHEQDGTARLLAKSGDSSAQQKRARQAFLEQHLPEVLRAGEPRWPDGADRQAGLPFACVPIKVDGRPLGALAFQFPAGRRLRREDHAFASALAQLCGPAIERARLYEAERNARELAEEARGEAEAATQRAREAVRLKEEFLGVVSHELRTPLNAILGWASMLRSGAVRAESTARAFDIIERNARLQARLVDDLLDASRIISDKLPLSLQLVDLGRVAESARDSVAHGAAAKGVDIRLTLPPAGTPAPIVRGDPRRLEQVVDNLLTNAIKFTPAGGAIEVRIQRADGHALVEVRDTGEGIEPDVLPHIFDRFRQGDATTTRRHGGLGLGLAIVRHLVEAHGGEVRAESDGKNRGATVTVELPLDPEGSVPQEPPAAIARIPRRLEGVCALVVDDAPDSRDIAAAALVSAGATVRSATATSAALALLLTFDADVLVADIGMPGEDGYSLIQQIRARPRARGPLPALALTAYAGEEDRAAALAASYQAHLAKPVDPSRLVEAVADLLKPPEPPAERPPLPSAGRTPRRPPRRTSSASSSPTVPRRAPRR